VPILREKDEDVGPVSQALRAAAISLGHPQTPDVNAPDSRGVSPIAWNRVDGRRVSTNDAYLEPARARANLTIRAQTRLLRVVFDGKRAVGVEVETSEGVERIEAGEVVISAGALNSPAILLRSGVGPAAALRALGIRAIADLPGVGQNLCDHPMACLTFRLPMAMRDAFPRLPSGCLLRFESKAQGSQRNELQIMPLERIPCHMDIVQGGLLVSFLRPASRGTVELESSDPKQAPRVDFRMLSERSDVLRLAEAVRHAAELVRCSAMSSLLTSGLYAAGETTLDSLDDGQLCEYLIKSSISHFHAAGTCRMGGEDDPMAVVDTQGRVREVTGLRVVDASIMPDLPTAATHVTTVMLAEHIHRLASWAS
jgi:choline dehydrogenase